jgi:quinoprotein glucose dehydrogenase
LYVYSFTRVTPASVVPSDGTRSDMDYITDQARDPRAAAPAARAAASADAQDRGNSADVGVGGVLTVQGLPLIKPPYAHITAFDMNKGDILWQVAHGDTPDNIRTHPALKGLTIPRTGRLGEIGILVTKTLVVAGEGGTATTPNGQRGAMLRAYDKATGAEVGAVYMPAPQSGSPMTYMLGGKQYIVVAVSGGAYSGELLAFRLPS